jgi:hypothetical protein
MTVADYHDRVLTVQFAPWPLLLTVVSGTLTDADVVTLKTSNEAALQRGGRIISLVDVTQVAAVPTALQRKNYAAWRKEHFAALQRHVVAVGFAVGDRPLLRGGLTALSWLAKHPSPEAFFAGRNEALDWLHAQLENLQPSQGPRPPRSLWPRR